MGFLRHEKHECEDCHEKFANNDELAKHARDSHKRHILKCSSCGKLFLHEKDRLHHAREENEKKVDFRRHKS